MKSNWKKLFYDETHYKETSNINKLLDISYEFFEKHSGVGNFIYWYLKIAYYTGRAKDNISFERYLQFAKDKKGIISLIINAEEVQLSRDLFKIGYSYPDLSNEQYNLVNNLYQIDKHRDLLDDIFFDQNNLTIKFIKKSEISPSKVRNSQFSSQLISEVFEGFLINYKLQDSRSESFFYYNRALNKVEQIKISGSAKFVHFYIDLNITNRVFVNKVKVIISEDIYEKLLEKMSIEKKENNLTFEITFDDYGWKKFSSFIESEIENEVEFKYVKNLMVEAIITDWLKDLNQIN